MSKTALNGEEISGAPGSTDTRQEIEGISVSCTHRKWY